MAAPYAIAQLGGLEQVSGCGSPPNSAACEVG